MRQNLRYIIPILIPLIILLLPASAFPIEGLTVIQQRVIAIFLLAALCWVMEPIPIYATSVVIIVLELLLLSDKSLYLFRLDEGQPHFGNLMSYSEIMATFASPIIMLFLGGFFLAMAATKYRLDVNLARVLLKPFGHQPKYVMFGLMLITAIFSMFMSNTATTAMMLSILAPVITLFGAKDPGKIAFALCIPVAANIGGIGTPIGTPPNAIALKYLTGENLITFGEWMFFGVPFVAVLLVFAWWLINKMYPATQQSIELTIQGKFLKTPKAITVYVTFAVTIILWLMGSMHGMNSYTVALIPVAIFSLTGIINKEDLKKISWDVLWLVSGGIALGLALDKTGLARLVVHSIPFDVFSPYAVLFGAAMLCLLMANFMSHTATANLLMPIMAALGTSMVSLTPLGGEVTLILVVTFAASLGMSLPISTPPNALAHATGHVESNQMARVGVIIGVVGVLLSFVMIWGLQVIDHI
ncbi:DASS family sodium-coupled anion symporter [Photobacterium phosphoreum]|jgi:sodium-dependent dicarboxylate transporter 2/3/5|uniref:DASS family sodium-coupled anion symporter n=1 Tax=Photobacterium phosphoreum TaxID=659 RepID=A0AAW4ZUB6_PHOPO|nr:SLC13 family permease [Photobacterium phosphoreum]KJF85726.1 dihydroorotate dehydrogenase [Photobacterium phosphoreum]MCD9462986.1 dihydroorotate dehydrogenase [Photobacterium phosphoreum]MCD9474603.1 DASS family sodium-coupled anion symporter [Photobacterium phosphoreum]MCD9478054.1 DASS family sodium-coupled anion symporter [Photobacterium phosphoreum]MCD9482659.1 DASS family sodium-coupled anion symporter [Photobacterium phosphoreum]